MGIQINIVFAPHTYTARRNVLKSILNRSCSNKQGESGSHFDREHEQNYSLMHKAVIRGGFTLASLSALKFSPNSGGFRSV